MSRNLSFLVYNLRTPNFELLMRNFEGEFTYVLTIFFEETSILCLENKHELLELISPSNKTKLLRFILAPLEIILTLLLLVDNQ